MPVHEAITFGATAQGSGTTGVFERRRPEERGAPGPAVRSQARAVDPAEAAEDAPSPGRKTDPEAGARR